ncbi:MAG: hypothetical protein ACPGU5_00715 [Lishizhenia sp.]
MKIEYIETQEHLEKSAATLLSCSSIGIDLEFDKNHYRYGFNLCLIQIFDGETCYLFDPIDTQLDLTSIYTIVSNPSIEKICFAFGEDMRLLHHLGCKPQNINDLGNARSLLNYPPLSLSNLLKETLDIASDKTMQKSNWFKRPLSKEQINYAADDVLYLFELKDVLYKALDRNDRISWVQEENAAYDTVSYPDQIGVVTVKNNEKKLFTSYDFHIYEGLLRFREKTAERIGKPSYQIIKKEILSEIARGKLPTHNWLKQKGVFRSLLNKDYQYRIDAEHRKLISEANELKISKTASALQPLDRETRNENRRKRTLAERVKSEIYLDIKNEMIERYGSEFATFVMPNHIMLSLAAKEIEHILPYRLALIKEIGNEIGKQVNY